MILLSLITDADKNNNANTVIAVKLDDCGAGRDSGARPPLAKARNTPALPSASPCEKNFGWEENLRATGLAWGHFANSMAVERLLDPASMIEPWGMAPAHDYKGERFAMEPSS